MLAGPRFNRGTATAVLTDWCHEPPVRERVPARVRARRGLHDPVAIADPVRNAESVLATARECDADAVAVAVFPELCLTGYAIDDLVLQDAVLDAVEAAIATLVAGAEERFRCSWSARRCATATASTTAPS